MRLFLNNSVSSFLKLSFLPRHPLLPCLSAGRCHGDTRENPERHRVITGRLSKEEAGEHAGATAQFGFIFGCGGTGGHIYPALALAHEFALDGHATMFIGNADSMEERLVSREGYPFLAIQVKKLSRKLHPSLLAFPFFLVNSIVKCVSHLRKHRPDGVICTGGYVSGPVAIAAILLKIPLYFHESNSFPGITTRYLAKRTTITFVCWDFAFKYLKGAPVKMSQIPLMPRKATQMEPEEKLEHFDRSKPIILITGGSQGSLKINEAIDQALDSMLAKGWQLIWQTGKIGYQTYSSKHQDKQNVHIFAFSPSLPLFYNMADLAISRSGAMTLAEQMDNHTPAILIPLPSSAENHQFYNAKEQEDKGIAICLEQKNLNAQVLIDAVEKILINREDYRQNLIALPPNTARKDICQQILNSLEVTHAGKNS